MCRFADLPHPLYDGQPAPNATKVCDGAGDKPFCALCPSSLTFWELTADPPSASPWDGTGETTVVIEDLPHRVDKLTGEGWYMGPAGPCVLCLAPSKLYSPKDVPVHKACAERYIAGERRFAVPR